MFYVCKWQAIIKNLNDSIINFLQQKFELRHNKMLITQWNINIELK